MQISSKTGRDIKIPTMIMADSRKNDGNNKLDKELQIAYLRAKNMGTHFVKFPIVFKGTEDMVEEYHNYWFHIKGFFIGEILALVICTLAGLIIQFVL